MHTGAGASIHEKSRSSPQRELPLTPGALIAGFGTAHSGAKPSTVWLTALASGTP